MSWYRKSFGEDYIRIYSHRDGKEAEMHVDFAQSVLGLKEDDNVLDLACGYGRHSIEMAKRKLRVTGLDLSEYLLNIAAQNASRQNLNIQFLQRDMRDIPFENHFDAVASFFTSFGYFESDEENGQVVKSLTRALKPGGQFFLDYLNVRFTLDNIIPMDQIENEEYSITQHRSFDPISFRIMKKILLREKNESREYRESVRVYGLAEMGSFFADAGLVCTAVYGDYDDSAYNEHSKRLIMIGKKETQQ